MFRFLRLPRLFAYLLIVRRARRQLITAVVVLVVGVSLGPGPMDVVTVGGLLQFHPQILIHHRFFRCGLPAIALPAMDPGSDAVFQVLRIGDHLHFAGLLKRAQAFNGGGEFHPVIGGIGGGPEHFASMFSEAQYIRPTAWTGIAQAGAISD
jgi:hypothetical protein